ncbi:phosphatidate phosphatase APP1 [Microbacterium resistens]|uniref:Phosphatidate phosphatase APP1 n=1 Tax=Microbacterium resistens TaxID=156977 RepID=A0ABU1SGS5_9MICO|nr:phosphatase domain-containing protein [Microbacterium resistens]MDR6868811.1 phosphatidate phosphatase APP1 [Microbacterium resistens]
MSPSRHGSERIHWFARLEHRFHAWRERRARRRGRTATVLPFPGYGGPGWVRVLGRVLIVPPRRRTATGEFASVRGWRSFVGIPVSFSTVQVTIGGHVHDVTADRGGVIDCRIEADLPAGWQTLTMSVEGQEPIEARVFVVPGDVTFGVVSDVDDTVMVTALPRPLIAAWNSFVVDEHARIPVPGMAVLLERVRREQPGSPMIYLSTGAWNIAPTLTRFLTRHLFPSGAILLTDWGPTHDRWFRSGREHKLTNLRRLAAEFPHVRWLLIGDDGQHDEAIYSQFLAEHPHAVAGVAIRRLLPAEAVLAGGRTTGGDDHSEGSVPWVSAENGAGILEKLAEAGVIR